MNTNISDKATSRGGFFDLAICSSLLVTLLLPPIFSSNYGEDASHLFLCILCIRQAILLIINPKLTIHVGLTLVLLLYMLYLDLSLNCIRSVSFAALIWFSIIRPQWKPEQFFYPVIIFLTSIYFIGYLDLLKVNHWWVNEHYPDAKEYVLKSVFSQKNEFQFISIIGLLFLYYYKPKLNNKVIRIWFSFVIVFGCVLLLVSNAKTVLASVIIASFFVFLTHSKINKFLSLFIVFLIMAFGLYLTRNMESIANRLYIWDASLSMIMESPFFGWGPGQFQFHIKNYFDSPFSTKYILKVWNSPHNFFIDVFVQYGLVGLILWLFSIYKAFWLIEEKGNNFSKMTFIVVLINACLINPISVSVLSHFVLVFIIQGSVAWEVHGKTKITMMLLTVALSVYLGNVVFQHSVKEKVRWRFNEEVYLSQINQSKADINLTKILSLYPTEPDFLYYDFLRSIKQNRLVEIRNTHEKLFKETKYMYDWQFPLAVAFSNNQIFAACLDNINVILNRWKMENVDALNVKAKCLFHLNCQEFINWKSEAEVYFGSQSYWKSSYWNISNCPTDNSGLKD